MLKYKFFKISIGLGFFRIYSSSKVYTIKNIFMQIGLSIWYTVICLLFGWWGGFRSIKYTLEAIHINLSGGMDFTEEMEETEYGDKTNYIWKNLLRETTEKVSKEQIDMILDIQESFEESGKEVFTDENMDYIYSNLIKIKTYNITREHIKDVFDTNQLYLGNLSS